MIKFEEASLKVKLSKLERLNKVGFALSATSRIVPYYSAYCSLAGVEADDRVRKYLKQLWEIVVLGTGHDQRIEYEGNVSNLLGIMPGEDDPWNEMHPLAEDAIASLTYSYRCLASNDPQEAVWAARCAYEAADQRAIQEIYSEEHGPIDEKAVLNHPAVQRELFRQSRDFKLAERGERPRLLQLASDETLLDDLTT